MNNSKKNNSNDISESQDRSIDQLKIIEKKINIIMKENQDYKYLLTIIIGLLENANFTSTDEYKIFIEKVISIIKKTCKSMGTL